MLVRQVAILSISVIAVGKGCTGRSGAELDDGETTRKPEQWCARIRGHWPVYSPGQLTKPIHALHIHEAMQDKNAQSLEDPDRLLPGNVYQK
jgi:hypothetical protein